MKILFLDDDEFRHEVVRKQLTSAGVEIVAVKTAKDAIDRILREKFDFIFLDHDLDGTIYAPSGPGTGFEVAGHVSASVNRDTRVIVHSLNHLGAEKMVQAIGRNATWVPFYGLPKLLAQLFQAQA